MTHKPKLLSLVLSVSALTIIAYAVISAGNGNFDFRRKANQINPMSEADLIQQVKDQTLTLVKTIQKPTADTKEQAQTRKQIVARLMKQNPAEFLKIAFRKKSAAACRKKLSLK